MPRKKERPHRQFLIHMGRVYSEYSIADAIEKILTDTQIQKLVVQLTQAYPVTVNATERLLEETQAKAAGATASTGNIIPFGSPEHLGTCEDCRFYPAIAVVPPGLKVCSDCYRKRAGAEHNVDETPAVEAPTE